MNQKYNTNISFFDYIPTDIHPLYINLGKRRELGTAWVNHSLDALHSTMNYAKAMLLVSELLMELLKKRLHWDPIIWYRFKSGSLEAQPVELAFYSLLSVLNVMLTWQLQALKSWWAVKWLVCYQKYLYSLDAIDLWKI